MKVEHVQPVQSLTPGRGAGVRAWLTVALPVVVLVAVVAGGLLGRSDGTPSLAVGPSSPLPSSPNPRASARTEAAIDAYEAIGFPRDAIGLTVRSVDETLDRLREGRTGQKVVAVAGWLTVRPPRTDCRDEYDRGTGPTTLCPRDTILLGSPAPLVAVEDGEARRLRSPGSHLHPVALPGVSLVEVTGREVRAGGPELRPVPVVIVGRLDDPRLPDCRPWERGCGSLSLERVIWIDGEWQGRRAVRTTTSSDPAEPSDDDRRRRIDEAVRGAGTILSEILLPRDALAGVDRAAAAAVVDSVEDPVWYVRVLIRVLGPEGSYPRGVSWAVVDDASGSVVAAHPMLTSAVRSRWP